MGTRLASMMVSLHHDPPLRLLVPYRTSSGRLAYRVETQRKAPAKRGAPQRPRAVPPPTDA